MLSGVTLISAGRTIVSARETHAADATAPLPRHSAECAGVTVRAKFARRPHLDAAMGKRKRTGGGAPSTSHAQELSHPNAVAGHVVIPQVRLRGERRGTWLTGQKRWYRQRAHANPFSDHSLV